MELSFALSVKPQVWIWFLYDLSWSGLNGSRLRLLIPTNSLAKLRDKFAWHVAVTANHMRCVIFAYSTFNHTARPKSTLRMSAQTPPPPPNTVVLPVIWNAATHATPPYKKIARSIIQPDPNQPFECQPRHPPPPPNTVVLPVIWNAATHATPPYKKFPNKYRCHYSESMTSLRDPPPPPITPSSNSQPHPPNFNSYTKKTHTVSNYDEITY